jgi:hypothetical protein
MGTLYYHCNIEKDSISVTCWAHFQYTEILLRSLLLSRIFFSPNCHVPVARFSHYHMPFHFFNLTVSSN